MKASPRRGDIQLGSSSGVPRLRLKCAVLSAIETYFLPLGVTKGESNRLNILGVSGTAWANNSEKGFSCLVLGILLGSLWFLEGVPLAQVRKVH